MKLKRLVLWASIAAASGSTCALAAQPQTTVMAMAGNYASTWDSMLFPVSMTSNKLTYTDFQFEGSGSGAGMLSGGAGLRKTAASGRVSGAYLFYDRQRDSDQSYFSFFSPGVESLSSVWSIRANVYVPFGSKEEVTSSGWAGDFGDDQFVVVTGHDEYDRYQYNENRVSLGGDVAVSYRLPQSDQWQVSMAPYSYRLKDESNMVGGRVKLDYQKSDALNLFLEDRYDNKNNNRVVAGVSYRFGGSSADHQNMMLSPVYRNLNLNTTQDGMALSHRTRYGDLAIANSDIEFVEESTVTALASGSEDGTAENPYTDIDSAIAAAEDDGQIWVEGGVSFTSSGTIELAGTQALAGRTDDFKLAATSDDDRPTIYAEGIEMLDSNSLSDFVLYSPTGTEVEHGVLVTASGDSSAVLDIDHVSVGALDSDNGFAEGVAIENNINATIEGSTFYGYHDGSGSDDFTFVEGLYLGENSSAVIDNSLIVADAESSYDVALTVIADEGASVEVTQSTITAEGNGGATAAGVVLYDANGVFNHDVINAEDVSETNGEDMIGIISQGSGSSTVRVENTTINVDDSDDVSAAIVAYNRYNYIYLKNDIFNVEGSEDAVGVMFSNYNDIGYLDATNVTMNIDSDENAYGIYEYHTDLADITLDTKNMKYHLSGDVTKKHYVESSPWYG